MYVPVTQQKLSINCLLIVAPWLSVQSIGVPKYSCADSNKENMIRKKTVILVCKRKTNDDITNCFGNNNLNIGLMVLYILAITNILFRLVFFLSYNQYDMLWQNKTKWTRCRFAPGMQKTFDYISKASPSLIKEKYIKVFKWLRLMSSNRSLNDL